MTLSTRTPSALAAALRDIQAPVKDELALVSQELWRIVAADVPLVQDVQQHLMGMKGKLFRPTLLLLSASIEQPPPPRATTFAAVVELIKTVFVAAGIEAVLMHLKRTKTHCCQLRGKPVCLLTGQFAAEQPLFTDGNDQLVIKQTEPLDPALCR